MMWKCDEDNYFKKGNNVLRLLLRCIDLWVSREWDDFDSTDIMESHRWSYSVGESRRGSYDFVCSLKNNLVFQVIWIYLVIWDYEILRWLYAWVCGFTMSSMTSVGFWMLISIYKSSKNRIKCLSMWVSRNLTWVMWMMNVIDTWWFCANYENLVDYACY